MGFFSKTKTTADGGQISISYSILGIGLLVLIITVVAIKVCDYNYGWNIALREYISMCSFGCITIALIYNATALQYNFEINKAKLEQDRQASQGNKVKITYEAISEWYKVDMAGNADTTRRFMQTYKGKLNNARTLTNFKNQLNAPENVEVMKSLTSVLNYFEHLSLLCVDNVIDEEILRKAFRTAFLAYYNNMKEYIEDEQRGNDGGNSKLFINFVEITKKWLYN